jgi:hypothetical protein
VQALPRIADERRQPLLDVEMDVLEVARPGEISTLDFVLDGREAALDRREILGTQHAGRREHPGVRERALDVDGREPAIEVHRRRVALDERRNGLGEPARPGFGAGGGRGVLVTAFWRRLGVGHVDSIGSRQSAPKQG